MSCGGKFATADGVARQSRSCNNLKQLLYLAMSACLPGLMAAATIPLVLGTSAKAITYTFNNVQFVVDELPYMVMGSFDFDGSTGITTELKDFDGMEVTRWLDQGQASSTPDSAQYFEQSGQSLNSFEFSDGNPPNEEQLLTFSIGQEKLTGQPQTIVLTGRRLTVTWCTNPSCNEVGRGENLAFTSGTLTSIPGSLAPATLSPLIFVLRQRKRLNKPLAHQTASESLIDSSVTQAPPAES